MPPRAPPKAYQLLLKTHRITIFFTAHPSATITTLKEEALSALTSDVSAPSEDDDMLGENKAPRVECLDDFELCRVVKDKGRSNASSSASAPVSYETLNPSTTIKGLLSNWETLYIQFRDENGDLLPVEVSQPSLLDEEEEEGRRSLPTPSPVPVNKGKRKAPPV